jgi:hypothetical protein
VVRADGREGGKLGSALGNQTIELGVELGDLLREGLVTAGHRTERALLRGRGHVTGAVPESKAGGRRGELLRREFAQTVAQLCSGAVRRKAWIWLAACVLALTAERRAVRRALIISTFPSPLLGTPEASPAKTALAAACASMGSDLPLRLRWRRLGLSISTTEIPVALRWRASPAP